MNATKYHCHYYWQDWNWSIGEAVVVVSRRVVPPFQDGLCSSCRSGNRSQKWIKKMHPPTRSLPPCLPTVAATAAA
jgi:hypothetical protein